MTAASLASERAATPSRRGIPRLAAVVVTAVGLVSMLTSGIVTLLSDRVSAEDGGWPWQLIGVAGVIVGGVIAIQRPDHRVGWIFLGFVLGPLSGALLGLRLLAAEPAPSWWITVPEAMATLGFAAPIPLILLVFPTGRLLSPRWLPAVALTLLSAVVGSAAALIRGGWAGQTEDGVAPSPLSPRLDGLGAVLSDLFFPLYLGSLVAALASVLLRYRRSRGDERLQLRWLAAAAGVVVAMTTLSVGGSSFRGTSDLLVESLLVAALCLVPVSAGVAVLRYRLYDIDVVISRALVFGALAAFITATYALVVVALPRLVVGPGSESNLLLSIVATGLVAVAFEPLRARLQGVANRLVYGQRATPYEVLTALTAGFAVTEVGSDGPQRLAGLLAAGTGAAEAVVWLRVGDELRAVAQAPPGPGAHASVAVTDQTLPSLGAQVAVPVRDGTQLIGALGITKARGDAVTSADHRLLDDVTGNAGLLLRNLQLQAEMRDHADELQESRARLVTTQDAARRRLERDLHDGAQQHLVALRLKLGLAGTLARREGADAVADGLSPLSDTTQHTVDAVRAVARGIYPPLLEAEGLAAAVTGAARLAGVPVSVLIDGLARYPREIESTVYFCIVEAINNAATHAQPTSVEVIIEATENQLTFSVHDDGIGFDPSAPATGTGLANLADRLDVLGGTLAVESRAGSGTTITGWLPAPPSAQPLPDPTSLVSSGRS